MLYYAIKVLVSALLIVVAAEVAKRDTVFGGFIASLPLVSFTALVWLYVDTGDSERVAQLSHSIFWLVLPTLPFFSFTTGLSPPLAVYSQSTYIYRCARRPVPADRGGAEEKLII